MSCVEGTLWYVCSVLLQDINTRKPFRSSVIKDQQVVSLATRPLAIAETYHRCEPPPALQKLNPYRQVSPLNSLIFILLDRSRSKVK